MIDLPHCVDKRHFLLLLESALIYLRSMVLSKFERQVAGTIMSKLAILLLAYTDIYWLTLEILFRQRLFPGKCSTRCFTIPRIERAALMADHVL